LPFASLGQFGGKKMKQRIDHLNRYQAVNHWCVNLLIDTSSGAACKKALCESCGNREIATPTAIPISIPGALNA